LNNATLNATSGTIGTATITTLNNATLNASSATITTATITTLNNATLNASSGTISTATITTLNNATLNATSGTIGTATITTLNNATLNATSGKIGSLTILNDVSLNGNLTIGNDIIIKGRLKVQQYQNQNIINTTTTNYQLIVSEDLSLNGRLYVSGDVSFNNNLYVGSIATITTLNNDTLNVNSGTISIATITTLNNDTLNVNSGTISNATITTLNNDTLNVNSGNIATLNIIGNTSLNGDLFVNGNLNFKGKLNLGPNIITTDSIIEGVNNKFGIFQYNYQSPTLYDIDPATNFLITRYNVPNSETHYAIYTKTDLNISGNITSQNDMTVYGNLTYGGRLYLAANSISSDNIISGINNKFGTFQYTYQSPTLYDINPDTNFLITRYNVPSSETHQVLHSVTDLNISGNITSQNDMTVYGNLTYGGKLYLSANSISSDNIISGINNKFGTFQYIYQSPTLYDINPDTNFLITRYNVPSSETHQVLFSQSDITINGNIIGNLDCSINGNLSIGSDLLINGRSTATAFDIESDYRIKANVKSLLDTSFTVDLLKPVTYINKKLNTQDIGFIAHEVQEQIPFLVNGEKDGNTLQRINYNGIIGLLTKEIQEIKKENITLREHIKNIENYLSEKFLYKI